MRALFLLPLLLLTACELVVDIDVPRADPVLAVDAPFEVGQSWGVVLSRSVPVQDGDFYGSELRVTGAAVEIYRGEVLVERLREVNEADDRPGYGYYSFEGQRYTGTMAPQAGHTYTLRISHPDYASISATDTAPIAVDPARLSWRVTERPKSEFGFTFDQRFVEVDVADDALTTHYALGFSVQNRYPDDVSVQFDPEPPQNVGFTSASALFVRGTSDPFDINSGSYYETGFFADDTFQGGSVTLRADLEQRGVGCFYPSDRPDLAVCQTSEYSGSVYSVSPAYFAYVRSLIAYRSGGGGDNPLSEPTRVQGNIEGGLGLFAGRARTQVRLIEKSETDDR